MLSYLNPVGNSSVPYPYAIDDKGNYYELSSNVIVTNYNSKVNDFIDYYSQLLN